MIQRKLLGISQVSRTESISLHLCGYYRWLDVDFWYVFLNSTSLLPLFVTDGINRWIQGPLVANVYAEARAPSIPCSSAHDTGNKGRYRRPFVVMHYDQSVPEMRSAI